MTLNVAKELAELRRMSVADLRSRYAEVFGETRNARHKDWLVKRVIWRMQCLAEGDISERARARAAELATTRTCDGGRPGRPQRRPRRRPEPGQASSGPAGSRRHRWLGPYSPASTRARRSR